MSRNVTNPQPDTSFGPVTPRTNVAGGSVVASAASTMAQVATVNPISNQSLQRHV